MSNLIVNILGLALAAALTAAALNYAGDAYMESKADAQAVQLLADATKVATGLRTWVRMNGTRTLTDTDWSDGTTTDLINGSDMIIDTLPKLGAYAQGNGGSDYYFKTMPIADVEWANEGTNFNALFAVVTDAAVCKAVARRARGDSAVPIYRNTAGATMGDFSSNLANSDFDCVVNDADNDSSIDSGESMFFLYKVF